MSEFKTTFINEIVEGGIVSVEPISLEQNESDLRSRETCK